MAATQAFGSCYPAVIQAEIPRFVGMTPGGERQDGDRLDATRERDDEILRLRAQDDIWNDVTPANQQ